MKKKLSVYLPNGRWSEFEEGVNDVESICNLNSGVVSVLYRHKQGEVELTSETVYSGMPFILSEF